MTIFFIWHVDTYKIIHIFLISQFEVYAKDDDFKNELI